MYQLQLQSPKPNCIPCSQKVNSKTSGGLRACVQVYLHSRVVFYVPQTAASSILCTCDHFKVGRPHVSAWNRVLGADTRSIKLQVTHIIVTTLRPVSPDIGCASLFWKRVRKPLEVTPSLLPTTFFTQIPRQHIAGGDWPSPWER